MNITHIAWSFNTGGIETMLIDIMSCQTRDGHNVRLVVVNDDYDAGLLSRIPRHIGVTLLRRAPGSRSPWFLIRLWLLAVRSDVVHCHQQNLPKLIIGPHRAKIVLTVHSFQNHIDRIPKSCHIAAVSREVAEDLHCRGLKSAVATIPNGLPLSAIPSGHTPAYAGGTFKIVHVGRLVHPTKGQDILIRAIVLLKRQGIENVTVDFIGEGGSECALRQLAIDTGVNDRIRFLGCRSREYIYAHLCDYHLMVHPARQEGFGLTVAEAMAARLPVLVSDIGPLRSLTQQGKAGYLFRNGDPARCASAIEMIMRDYSDAAVMTDSARRHVCECFSVEKQCESYMRIYLDDAHHNKC